MRCTRTASTNQPRHTLCRAWISLCETLQAMPQRSTEPRVHCAAASDNDTGHIRIGCATFAVTSPTSPITPATSATAFAYAFAGTFAITLAFAFAGTFAITLAGTFASHASNSFNSCSARDNRDGGFLHR